LLGEQHLWHGENPPFDPEGLLSTLPSVATILLGYLVAAYVQQKNDKAEMIKNVIIFGVAAITISEIWNFSFPINKKLWTSSYVLQMAGIDCLILAIAIWAIDLMGWNRNTKFFEVFGANAIAAYIISEVPIILLLKNKTQMLLADGTSKTISYYGWIFRSWFEPTFGSYFGSFMFAFIWMLICWCILYAMYQRKIFLKL
jgi:predicted acyltransferase